MTKTISKAEVIKIINQTEPLEVQIDSIDRNETVSSKQTKVNKFINAVQKQIKDQRDILMITIKLK